MSADAFELRVLTPQGLVLEERVSEVTLPAEVGQIGILPRHTKYIGNLGSGVLAYQRAGGGGDRLTISGGFASFVDEVLTVLADRVENAADRAAAR